MTAIAWAITFVGLIFYGAIYDDKIKAIGADKAISGITVFSLVLLMIATFIEWSKK